MTDFIELRQITKVFPPSVLALDAVSVSFRRGEIHAVVGENGAGKSTLMKVLYGLEPATAGEVRLDGQRVHFRGPGDAIARGLGMVHQELLLINEYTVWENVILGVEPEVSNVIDSAERARRLLDEMKSPNLKIVMDGANLFHHGELPRMSEILDRAFELLGDDIIIAHAKDLVRDGEAGNVAAGTGLLDYERYLRLLDATGRDLPILLHSLSEQQAKSSVAFLREKQPLR